MVKTVTALYDNYPKAKSAVQDLVNHDFQRDDISIMAQEALTEDDVRILEEAMSGMPTGLGLGAAVGGVGGLVLGLSALAIPGIGPAIVGGTLVAALVGAGVGAAAGGIIGALVDMGVPDEEAHYYAEGVRRGGVLVMVHAADDVAERAASILDSRPDRSHTAGRGVAPEWLEQVRCRCCTLCSGSPHLSAYAYTRPGLRLSGTEKSPAFPPS